MKHIPCRQLSPFLALFFILVSASTHASSIAINEIFAQGKGKRPDWIEVYNQGNVPVDLGGYTLTDSRKKPRRWVIPESTIIRPHDFLLFFADKKDFENHTNFKLDAGGEFVGLYDPSGKCIDAFAYTNLPEPGSWARFPDGGKTWSFCTMPTMGSTNKKPAQPVKNASKVTPVPEIFPTGGRYAQPQRVVLKSTDPTTQIYYTTDGSLPTTRSRQCSEPLSIDTTTVLRCMAARQGESPSEIVTQTFLIGEKSILPIISLVTDPKNLWDDQTGIYVKGTQWKQNNYDKELYNWKRSWKRPCNFEFFDDSSTTKINISCKIKIFGGASRNLAQKSFSLNVLDPSKDSFRYSFFPQKSHESFKSILLRNSGDDWNQTMLRDVLMHALPYERMDIDIQAWSPSVVFLNGKYWGIYNIREKIDPYYITNNYGIDPQKIDMIKCYNDIKSGNSSDYNSTIAFIRTHDLSKQENYNTVARQIDIDEYINYQLAQIFYDNCDWPQNNIAWWKERTPQGKWRWILYDTDEGFQLHDNKSSCNNNTLKWAMRKSSHSSVLFNALLRNRTFRDRFLQIFAAHMSTTFSKNRILEIIDALQAKIRPEMPRHIRRWMAISSMQEWEENLDELRRFAQGRAVHVYEHLIQKFNLEGTVDLSFLSGSPDKGKIFMDTVAIPTDNPTGQYFKNIPMTLHAVPTAGHKFVRWEGLTNTTDPTVSFTPQQAGIIRAVFQ
jgi:hypothetical protein